MDQAIRNKLRGVVTQCRKLLENSVSQELQGKFGIYAEKKDAVQVDDDARMSHLNRRRAGITQGHPRPFRAYQGTRLQAEGRPRSTRPRDRLHASKPFLRLQDDGSPANLCWRPEVSRGGQPGRQFEGVKFYLADHPDDERFYRTGKQDIAYRHFLDWLGELLSEEIGVLFSARRLGQPPLSGAEGARGSPYAAQRRGVGRNMDTGRDHRLGLPIFHAQRTRETSARKESKGSAQLLRTCVSSISSIHHVMLSSS